MQQCKPPGLELRSQFWDMCEPSPMVMTENLQTNV